MKHKPPQPLPAPLPPLGPPHYRGPSGDTTEGGAAWETVQRYEAIKRQVYSKDKEQPK